MTGPGRYRELGVRPVINVTGTLTRLGGSLMPPVVLEAMAEAAGTFVDLYELQDRVGARVAELTGNETGYVAAGAAAGVTLAVAACMAGTDPERIAAFPHLKGIDRTEVIIHRSQRNGYDYSARQTGAGMVEVDGTEESLSAAISQRTAAILWFAGTPFARDALPIEQVVEIAGPRQVPVLVDAAGQIPPLSTLWHFTREVGADAVIVSGGKGLRGPQSSGLVLGRREIIDGCRASGNPYHGIGRPMKVGKEEMLGLLAAVEWSLGQDEEALIAGYEATVAEWVAGLAGIPGIAAERGFPSIAGEPHPRAIVRIGPSFQGTRDEVVQLLYSRDPRIAVGTLGENALALNPQTIGPGEDRLVLDALRDVLLQPGQEAEPRLASAASRRTWPGPA
jgi:L-seryl-tRNA(Ser) seleniumtransferase